MTLEEEGTVGPGVLPGTRFSWADEAILIRSLRGDFRGTGRQAVLLKEYLEQGPQALSVEVRLPIRSALQSMGAIGVSKTDPEAGRVSAGFSDDDFESVSLRSEDGEVDLSVFVSRDPSMRDALVHDAEISGDTILYLLPETQFGPLAFLRVGKGGPCLRCLVAQLVSASVDPALEQVFLDDPTTLIGAPRDDVRELWDLAQASFKNRDGANVWRLLGENQSAQAAAFGKTRDCPACGPTLEPELVESSASARDVTAGLVHPALGLVRDVNIVFAGEPLLGEMKCAFAQLSRPLPAPVPSLGSPRLQATAVDPSSEMAEFKAVMEALERWSGMAPYSGVTVFETRDELRTAYPVERFINYSAEQYDRLDFRCVPLNDSDFREWAMVEGIDGIRHHVPVEFLKYDSQVVKPVVLETSNGMAAHTSIEKAVLSGFYEVVERDAFMVHWLTKTPPPQIPHGELTDYALGLVGELDEQGYSVVMLDITTELDVFAVAALAHRGEWPALFIGAASSANPEEAMDKALNELALQLVATRTAASAGKEVHSSTVLAHAEYYFDPARAGEWQFLLAGSERAVDRKRFRGIASREDLAELARIKGLDVLWADMTPPFLAGKGIVVTKVLVPNLQTIYFGEGNHRIHLERLEPWLGPAGVNMAMHPFA